MRAFTNRVPIHDKPSRRVSRLGTNVRCALMKTVNRRCHKLAPSVRPSAGVSSVIGIFRQRSKLACGRDSDVLPVTDNRWRGRPGHGGPHVEDLYQSPRAVPEPTIWLLPGDFNEGDYDRIHVWTRSLERQARDCLSSGPWRTDVAGVRKRGDCSSSCRWNSYRHRVIASLHRGGPYS